MIVMRVPMLGLALIFVLGVAGCSGSKPASSRSYSNAFTPRDVKSVEVETAAVVAGKNGKVYHTRNCRYAAALQSPVGYAHARDAEARGLIPCEFCTPQYNAVAPVASKPAEAAKDKKAQK